MMDDTRSCPLCSSTLVHDYVKRNNKVFDIISCVNDNCDMVDSKVVDVSKTSTERCYQSVEPETDVITEATTIASLNSFDEMTASGSSNYVAGCSGDNVGTESSSLLGQQNGGSKTAKRVRKLKTSQSSCDVSHVTPANDGIGSLKRSHTTDCAELSDEMLLDARNKFLQYVCCPLGHELTAIEELRNVLFCSQCNDYSGIDDTINFYDLQQDLESGRFRMEPCRTCGNTDPNLFVIDVKCDGGDEMTNVGLKCLKCCPSESSDSCYDSDSDLCMNAEVDQLMEIDNEKIGCECGNSNPDLFVTEENKFGKLLSVECLVCNSKLNVSRTICACEEDARHDMVFDEYGYVKKIVCANCKAEVDCEAASSTPSAGNKDSQLKRTSVTNLALLKRGDHIAWHQPWSYWHHAIVTHVDEKNSTITVVNYDGPNSHKGKIVEERKRVDVIAEQLYRIDYADVDSFHPDIVVSRARTRLGETEYNLLTNNCEHFARWCKTGQKQSHQAESFCRSLINRLKNGAYAAVPFPLKLFNYVRNSKLALKLTAKALADGSGPLSNAPANNVVKGELRGAAAGLLSGRMLSCAIVVGAEIQMVCRDIKNASDQRRDGHITRKEFIKITIKRMSEGGGSLTGIAIAMAIPFTRNSAGITVAAALGQGVGCLAGRQLSVLYDKVAGGDN